MTALDVESTFYDVSNWPEEIYDTGVLKLNGKLFRGGEKEKEYSQRREKFWFSRAFMIFSEYIILNNLLQVPMKSTEKK